MEIQSQSDIQLYESIIKEIYGQEYKNLNILLNLIIKHGIPLLLDLFNFQIFAELPQEKLSCQQLSLYYQILYLAQKKFQNIKDQKLDTEIYYNENLKSCEEEYLERFPDFDLKPLRDDIDKKFKLNNSEKLFLNFYINSKNINDKVGTINDLQQKYEDYFNEHINLISTAQDDQSQDAQTLNKIMIESIQNLFTKINNFDVEENDFFWDMPVIFDKFRNRAIEINQNDQNENDDDIDDDEMLTLSLIQSRSIRPENEKKLLQEIDQKYTPFAQENQVLQEEDKLICCRSYFVQGENLPLENQVIEYKNFKWPLENESFVIDKLQALICGMLNSKGGTVLIGVNDYCQVVGLNLTIKQQDSYKLFIHNKVLYNQQIGVLEPRIQENIKMSFIPVKSKNQEWIKGVWIFKLQILSEQKEFVYTLQNDEKSSNFTSYQRLDGQNKKLNLNSFKQLMYDKSKNFYLNKNKDKIHECISAPDKQGSKKCAKLDNKNKKPKQKSKSPKKKKKFNDLLKNQIKEILPQPTEDQPILRNQNPVQKAVIQENTQQQVKIFKNLNELRIFVDKKIKINNCLALINYDREKQEQLILHIVNKIGSGHSLELNKNIYFYKLNKNLIMYFNDYLISKQIGQLINESDLSEFQHGVFEIKIYRLDQELKVKGNLVKEQEFIKKIKQKFENDKKFEFDLVNYNQEKEHEYVLFQFKKEQSQVVMIYQLLVVSQEYRQFFESKKYEIVFQI